ncbi:tRNA (adenosine(37)-N6)-threonylcarbamoyltransferase complex dimerization subunit type 1 TsaB [bacterium]|nr:tRNA (adenosine(37)-N6)-threonylcarbamoyltransferase complex dimerization subunit type 1 TsaB [bacterium]
MIPQKIKTSDGLIAGIECSGESFSVALVQNGKCLACGGGYSPRSHLRRLFPALKECLDSAGASFKDLQAVAVTAGPGSFTGLRLGVVTARTVAQTTGCALIGVDTLEALAASHPGIPCLLAGLDARRSEVFAAFFDTSDGGCRRLAEDKAYKPEELAEACREMNCALAVGSGPVRYEAVLKAAAPELQIANSLFAQIGADQVAMIGERKLKEGKTVSPFELLPTYLRSADVMLG